MLRWKGHDNGPLLSHQTVKEGPHALDAKGSDFAVCRAPSEREAVAQLLPEMRAHVILVVGYDEIWRCYE